LLQFDRFSYFFSLDFLLYYIVALLFSKIKYFKRVFETFFKEKSRKCKKYLPKFLSDAKIESQYKIPSGRKVTFFAGHREIRLWLRAYPVQRVKCASRVSGRGNARGFPPLSGKKEGIRLKTYSEVKWNSALAAPLCHRI
jgi:hypothetical protein